MKLVQSLIIAAVVAVPAVSFAQSNAPITRAQVRAELVQLEKAGYNPGSDQTQYPKNIQAAEARVSAANSLTTESYGSPAGAKSVSGSRAANIPGADSVYLHP
jgi:hypothetical protein